MIAVVTGSNGHIGYNVALNLLNRRYKVVLLVRSVGDNILKLKNLGAIVYEVNLFESSTYVHLIKNADVLFHIAAENTTNISEEDRIIKNTYHLTRSVIETALDAGVKTIVYTSSVVVLGRSKSEYRLVSETDTTETSESPYVKGKLMAENFVREITSIKNADIRIAYPSWVVGPGDNNGTPPHKIILKFINAGQLFYFKGGISIASVDNIAEGHVNIWLHGSINESYILAGPNITFKEFYIELSKITGRQKPIIRIPKILIYFGSVVLNILSRDKNPIPPEYVKAVIGRYSWYNNNKAVKELNYSTGDKSEIIKKGVGQAELLRIQAGKLFDRHNHIKPVLYENSDVLLITGFPGWLSMRMVDIFINGDSFGQNKIFRKIKLLVQKSNNLKFDLPENFEIVYGDLTDKESLKKALQGVKVVYHLAGLIYPTKIKDFYKVNYHGTVNLVDACIASGVKRFLFMSTDSVCGFSPKGKIFNDDQPSKPYKNYGRSKYLAEQYIFTKTKEGLIDGTILRGFWFFGPFAPERNMKFLKMFRWKRQLVFGSGKNLRSISHIDNIVQAFVKAEKMKITVGKWYWIGDGTGTLTVDDIYQKIADAMGVKYNPVYVPGWICDLLAAADILIGKFGYLNATIHAAGKFHKNITAESIRAKEDFNYEPIAGFQQIEQEIKSMNL